MSESCTPPTDAEFEATFDAIDDVASRYGLTPEEAEGFLEGIGYFGDPDAPDKWADPEG